MSCLTDARKRRHIYIFAQLDPAFVWSTVHSITYNMFQRFYGLSTVLLFVTLTGAQAKCPVQLNPKRVVVRYGGSVAVNCSTSIPHKGIGWEASEGAVPKTSNSLITWIVSHLTEWDIQPYCYINYEGQCLVELPVIIYKTPDSVSISIVNHTGPMIEGQQYELQCDVHDVAPVQYLTVKWYKGQTLLNQTTFTKYRKTPVNVITTLLIRPDRDDDGAQYRCEAQLDLGAEGPQLPPKETSDPLYITVYFKPIINETKLPSKVPVFRGYSKEIVCEAEGNPKPTIIWILGTNDTVNNEVLTISELTLENVSCIAENYVGRMTRHVKVFIQENYIPRILGIIAAVVVVVIILILIYLTYCKKKPRRGHYDVKDPKTLKELLAHEVPMNELC